MEKDLMVFTNNKFGNVRVVIKDDEPYFVGIDVAKCLGYADPSSAVSKKCKHGVKTLVDIIVDQPCQYGNLPNRRQLTVIPEGDVYKLVFGSDLPNAIEFQDWVCDEVLPSIRKNGYYSVAPLQDKRASLIMSIVDAPDDVTTALAVKNFETYVTAPLKAEIEKQQEQLEEQAPKVELANERLSMNGCISIRDANKTFGLGQGKLMQWARNKGYIDKRKYIKEVNQAGRKYFKIYQNGEYRNIGITEEGMKLIKENKEEINSIKLHRNRE